MRAKIEISDHTLYDQRAVLSKAFGQILTTEPYRNISDRSELNIFKDYCIYLNVTYLNTTGHICNE
jgi:hypothetical protein